jgi:predicted dehydrogenase
MAPTYQQAKKLVDIASDKQCHYVTGFMRRHDRGVQLAKTLIKELLASEELGDILYFRAYCFGGGDYCNIDGNIKTDESPPRHLIWPISPDWVPKEVEKEYESFLNVFVHDVNLIRYLTDENPIIGNVDYRKNSGTITLEFVRFPGVFEFAYMETNRYWEEGIEIFFSRGRVVLKLPPAFLRNQPATVKIYKEQDNRSTEMRNPQADWSWSFKEQAKAFVNDVITNSDSRASGLDSLEDLKFVEDVWKKIV